jgi:uncharacterized protein with HEPN domain
VTNRSLSEFLQDILDALAEIERFTVGVDVASFTANREKILAVVKLLEMVGEAVKQVPNDIRIRYPNIPWKSVAGMKDILVHEYWDIDVAVVWATVQESLPPLKITILDILEHTEK